MNIQKRQSIQKLVIDQGGRQRLVLNDLILGFEGSETIAELIPQYHSGLSHIQIKGNNIDSAGFQIICIALASCPNLKSIEAEWNSIGTGTGGLQALCHLVKMLPYLQLIDLKNNRISHHLVGYICQIIQLNSKSLTVIDLRWNDLGQIGAQEIFRSLAYNSQLRYIGLQDNRISFQSLNQIQNMLNNSARGTGQTIPKHTLPAGIILPEVDKIFPISEKAYPSMQLQVKNAQLRAKIENEQNDAQIYQNKIKLQIDRTLQKLKAKGLQIHQLQIRFDSLTNQNLTLINQLREAERMLVLERQRYMGIDKGLNQQKTLLKTDKYHLNIKSQSSMQKFIEKNHRQIEQFQSIMNDKLVKLQTYYKQRVQKKRSNRDKLSQLKEDTMKLQMSKQSSWDKVTETYRNSNKNSLEEKYRVMEEIVAKTEFELKGQVNGGQNLSQQLSSIVLKGLQKEEKIEGEIFQTQNAIKQLHNKMGTTNVQIEQNESKSSLLQSKQIDKESGVDMRRKYIKYILSQSSINIEIERLKQQEDMKGERLLNQTIEMRITDLEKAIRIEQTHNKMIRNQYDKLMSQVETVSKRTIQEILFEV